MKDSNLMDAGVAIGNIGVGIAMGVPVGVALGFAFNTKKNKKPEE